MPIPFNMTETNFDMIICYILLVISPTEPNEKEGFTLK